MAVDYDLKDTSIFSESTATSVFEKSHPVLATKSSCIDTMRELYLHSRQMVASLSDPSGDKEYWLSKAPYERLKAVETLRQLNYGYSQSTSRLQRVLEIA